MKLLVISGIFLLGAIYWAWQGIFAPLFLMLACLLTLAIFADPDNER